MEEGWLLQIQVIDLAKKLPVEAEDVCWLNNPVASKLGKPDPGDLWDANLG